MMTETEYQRLRDERHELCTLLAGYAMGAVEAIAESNQISINVQKRAQANLAYMRPLMDKIWDLGEQIKAGVTEEVVDDTFEGKVNG